MGHNDAADADPAELAPGDVAVSPDGVTTEVNAPAQSTEAEYIQACLQARSWMDDHAGDQHSPVEAYLGSVQRSGTADAGTWDTPWPEMSPQRQAALIVAVRAAADEACG
ncbi:MAG TPA: lipoprotein LpqV [Mycolicibacillus parakoreensis]|uniref:Lipoprotein LpqV n=1 Tax=Mycolicibacillus parakoreensis TaxID=1069221 RepID=A0ABY3U6B5_9MYCO|nr:lipoprotein LpqV [Mycolicibacillus parakoreensis]ULN53515.1 lipoprotein LpqV [Mycolicibacillus parakoreensis]HLR99342.1 lipoprotein LpqV [Mycolicibacillus parakoreensis]